MLQWYLSWALRPTFSTGLIPEPLTLVQSNRRITAFNNAAAEFEKLLRDWIAILDGPMGTMIQTHKLDEAACRGKFTNHPVELKGYTISQVLELTE